MPSKKSASRSDEPNKNAPNAQKGKSSLQKKQGTPPRAASRSRSKPTSSAQFSHDGASPDSPDNQARIANRAYELYTQRGGHHGQDLEDWFVAERQVLGGER